MANGKPERQIELAGLQPAPPPGPPTRARSRSGARTVANRQTDEVTDQPVKLGRVLDTSPNTKKRRRRKICRGPIKQTSFEHTALDLGALNALAKLPPIGGDGGEGASSERAEAGDGDGCRACGSATANAMFVPCEHVLLCATCAAAIEPAFCVACWTRVDGHKATFVT
ncbi:uncharacterized protein AMSG_00535 [Thecamonas trahens ATCC 50062]|uniref:RING-type domain-containing protein n=1 Tax=Thecamonas trahens ATCC 50062 TaxID=461836 RepID=A0A0L0DBS8_THETB|nr:hypothetical protein AMSG_00535 [Thecamonas trahens ATCC 50062]KNC48758.1 hypothetical protein AMSG_00535 [Thecamonas trahens ATCC 50062]|eukprot:XP_013762809.1 hypothetical protein AMSG_00535 [Thecamonas trahens ATCC 50062]